MNNEYGPNFITLTDDEGNDIDLEYVDALEMNGQTYMAFFPVVAEGDDPESDEYIKDFEAIVATNAGGYDMSDGDPGGLLIMDGIQYKPCAGGGYFAILRDGTAKLGTPAEWNQKYAGTDMVK